MVYPFFEIWMKVLNALSISHIWSCVEYLFSVFIDEYSRFSTMLHHTPMSRMYFFPTQISIFHETFGNHKFRNYRAIEPGYIGDIRISCAVIHIKAAIRDTLTCNVLLSNTSLWITCVSNRLFVVPKLSVKFE